MHFKYRVFAVLALFLLIAFISWLILAHKDPVRVQFDQVDNGITRRAVEEILGKPFHEEAFGPHDWLSFQGDGSIGVVIIARDTQLVVAKSWRPQGPISDMELVRRWFRSE